MSAQPRAVPVVPVLRALTRLEASTANAPKASHWTARALSVKVSICVTVFLWNAQCSALERVTKGVGGIH